MGGFVYCSSGFYQEGGSSVMEILEKFSLFLNMPVLVLFRLGTLFMPLKTHLWEHVFENLNPLFLNVRSFSEKGSRFSSLSILLAARRVVPPPFVQENTVLTR